MKKKPISLEQAQKKGKINQFCKEHPSTGDKQMFESLLDEMANPKPPAKPKNSKEAD